MVLFGTGWPAVSYWGEGRNLGGVMMCEARISSYM